jgi:stage V sporulation protein K
VEANNKKSNESSLSFFFPELELIRSIKNKGLMYFVNVVGGSFTDIGRFFKRVMDRLSGRGYDSPAANQSAATIQPSISSPTFRVNQRELQKALAELDNITGLGSVKEFVHELKDMVEIQMERKKAGQSTQKQTLHMVFTGNPGTGKTTVARIVAKAFKALGVVTRGHLVEVTREDLVAGYVGHTAPKTRAKVQQAIGGVLFIDEAYSLSRGGPNDFGLEAIDALVKLMEEARGNLIVILAGYSKEMNDFMKSNSGLKSRFSNIIEFPDYTPEELLQIAKKQLKQQDFLIDDKATKALYAVLEQRQIPGRNDDGNGRLVRNIIDEAIRKQSKRLKDPTNLVEKDFKVLISKDFGYVEEQVFKLDATLSEIIGNTKVKEHIRTLEAQVKVQKKRRDAGIIQNTSQSLHMIFRGNPGTGKTTIARIVAQMLKDMGVLKSGQLIEVERGDLVAGYVGQTAGKTREIIKRALGGILFIDEAYSLSSGGENDFGKEAIDTLVKGMEDHRENLIVILAGYNDEMDNFLQSNPGLKSRFPVNIKFEDYSTEEMFQILRIMVGKEHYLLAPGCESVIIPILTNVVGNRDAGNGRFVRNLFERSLRQQALRLNKKNNITEIELMTLLPEDFKEVV